MQDTISQLKSLQDVLQTSQKEVQEKGRKVEELDKMLNESMEEIQQKDKNLKEKESKVVELDKALKERQWELKQKAAQVRNNIDSNSCNSFYILLFLLEVSIHPWKSFSFIPSSSQVIKSLLSRGLTQNVRK